MNQRVLIFFLAVWMLSGCNIFNPEEQPPTYLRLEPFQFVNPDSSITGSSSHSIPSVWVYADGSPVGVFDLPCTVPVIISKASRIDLFPAVANQGLKSYMFQYPYYKSDTITLQLNPGKTQSYTPVTRYSADLKAAAFRIKINFEENLTFERSSGDTSLLIVKSSGNVFEGTGSGAIYLDAVHKSSVNKSRDFFPQPSSPCYLELDYKSTLPFQVGLLGEADDGSTYGEYLAGFNPRGEWTKSYVELATFTKTYPGYSKFHILLRSALDDFSGKYTEGYVLFDNIKVISR